MRTPIAVALASVALLVSPFLAAPARAKPSKAVPAAHERDEAINAGIRYLDRTVLSLPDATGTPRKPFTVGVLGLVHLIGRDHGGIRSDGKKTLERVRSYLARYVERVAERAADPKQLPDRTGVFSSNDLIQYTWPLAMAALFHGESHVRGRAAGVSKRAIARIVPLLAEAQAPNGGWGHGKVRERGAPRGPSKLDGFGAYPDTLLASSNLVATCLGLVSNVVAPKQKSVLEKARAYYRYAELGNGNFPYDPSQRSAHMSLNGVSRAAGAVLAMRALGIPWKDVGIDRALEFVDDHFEYLSEGHGSSTHNLLLAALLQRSRGERQWKRFKQKYFPRLLAGQKEDGSFECICEGKAFGSTNDSRPFGGKLAGMGGLFADGTAAYVSAIHTLILLLDREPLRLGKDHGKAPIRAPVVTGGSKK